MEGKFSSAMGGWISQMARNMDQWFEPTRLKEAKIPKPPQGIKSPVPVKETADIQGITSPLPEQSLIPQPTSLPETTNPFQGFIQDVPTEDLTNLILDASKQTGVDPRVLAAILFQESGINQNVPESSGDRGIAQINRVAHPEVTDEQAMDPAFAIPWAAQYLADSMGKFGDINRAVASYNVGRGGANIQGEEPFGGGPLGQTYLDNVARNLGEEVLKELGIITR